MTKTIGSIIFLGTLSTLYSILNIGSFPSALLFTLPLSLTFFTLVFANISKDYVGSNVFKIFLTQALIRFCILPVLLSSEIDPVKGIDSLYLDTAIIIMILELFFCFLTFRLFSKYQKQGYINKLTTIEPLKNLVVVLIVLLFIFSILYTSNVFEAVNPVWKLSEHVEKYISEGHKLEVNNIAAILYTPFRAILALFSISLVFKTKRIKGKYKIWCYIAILILSNVFIYGISRFNIVLFTIPLMILITHFITDREAKKITYLTTFVILVTLITTSLAKFSRFGNEAELNSIISASSLSAYFSGPSSIAIGLASTNSITLYDSIMYLFNDTLQNIPMLSNFTSLEYKSTYTYNKYFYGHTLYADQIVPLSISGIFHFSTLGLFFYSTVFLSLALYMERLSYRTINIGYKYVFISLSVTLSLVFMLNIGSFYATLFRNFVFILAPLVIINQISNIKFGK